MLRFPPQGVMISIHAPREGSDIRLTIWQAVGPISIHAPREGSDGSVNKVYVTLEVFQSTLPVRGATLSCSNSPGALCYFNPRSP